MQRTHVVKLVIVLAIIVMALGLVAARPFETTTPPGSAPTAEPGSPPVAPPDAQAPDYAGFVASAALVLAATAFAKERLHLVGDGPVLGTAFIIVLVIAFYPDVIGALPAEAAAIVDKFVYGVLVPFIAATGGYDLTSRLFGLFNKKTATDKGSVVPIVEK